MKLRGKIVLLCTALFGGMLGYLSAPALIRHSKASEQLALQKKTNDEQKAIEANNAANGIVKDTTNKGINDINLDDLLDENNINKGEGDRATSTGKDEVVSAGVDGDDFIEEDEAKVIERLRKLTKNELRESNDGPVNEKNYQGKIRDNRWKNVKALKKQLTNSLRGGLRSTKQEDVMAYIALPENRLALAQWHLLNLADLDKLSKLMKDSNTCKALGALLNDLPWITGFLYDGEVKNVTDTLAILDHLRRCDPNMDKVEMTEGRRKSDAKKGDTLNDINIKKRIAGAVAAEYGRNGWYGGNQREMTAAELKEYKDILGIVPPKQNGRKGKKDPYRLARERYLFMSEGVDKRLYNSKFYTTPDWLLRFICGWKGDSGFGTVSTMKWLRENVSAPSGSYLGMGGQVPYRPLNIFGDMIFGAHYYQPFAAIYPDNLSKMTRDIGAVCGGVSHFGASAANANGIPAMTMGEPGHCAYTVYHEGKWHACNSIFPEKFPHWSFWGKSNWSTLTTYTTMYQAGARTRNAQLISTLADVLSSDSGNYSGVTKALRLYELSVSMQPLNRGVWNNYVDTAARGLKKRPKQWLAVNDFLCKSMAPESPESCASVLIERIYPAMLSTFTHRSQALEAYTSYFKALKKQEQNVWDIEALLNLQFAGIAKSEVERMKYYSVIAETCSKKPEFALAINWLLKTAHKQKITEGRKALKIVEKMRELSPNKRLIDAAIIRSAEELGNIELFKKYSKPYLKADGHDMNMHFPQYQLISNDATISLGSYHEDQAPIVNHAAALTQKGGHIQSEGGKHQKVTVVLPKLKRIKAITIVPNGGLSGYWEWNIESSKDGKTWETVIELPDRSKKPHITIEFNRKMITAKYIRIDSGSNQTQGINFKAILIYDNKPLK